MPNPNLVDDDAVARDAIPGAILAVIALITVALVLRYLPRDEFKSTTPEDVYIFDFEPPTATR